MKYEMGWCIVPLKIKELAEKPHKFMIKMNRFINYEFKRERMGTVFSKKDFEKCEHSSFGVLIHRSIQLLIAKYD